LGLTEDAGKQAEGTLRLTFLWSTPQKITDYREYRDGMVEPDFQAFFRAQGDLRAGLHSASSLFHMHDWVWAAHETTIRASFRWKETGIGPQPVTRKSQFADALADEHPDFELVRAIANASKHLSLFAPPTNRSLPSHRPSHAANTYVEVSYSWGVIRNERVLIEGSNRPLIDVLSSTRTWWDDLLARHRW
jgi:hypothetical protein